MSNTSNSAKIVISFENLDEGKRMRNGLMGILDQIKIRNCKPQMKENLKNVYDLLDQLNYALNNYESQ